MLFLFPNRASYRNGFCIGSVEQLLSIVEMNSPFGRTTMPLCKLNACFRLVVAASVILSLQACAVIAVADAAVTVVATGVKVTAKAVGAVVGAIIPGRD